MKVGWRARIGLLLAFTMAVGTVFSNALSVLAPYLTSDLQLSRSQFGVAASLVGLAAALIAPRSGRFVDVKGGMFASKLLFSMSAAAMITLAISFSVHGLFVAAIIAGSAMALTNPTTNHVLALNFDLGKRGWLMGIKQAGAQAGGVVAGTILPFAAQSLGWRGSVISLAVLGPIGFVLAHRLLAPNNSGFVTSTDSHRVGKSLSPDERRVVRRLTAFALLMAAGGSSLGAFLPLYTFEQFGVSQAVAGLTVAVMGTVGIVARIAAGPIAERFRRPFAPLVILASLTLVSVGLLWASTTGGIQLVWFAAALFGVGGTAWNTVSMLAVLRIGEFGNVGQISGRVMSGAYTGGVFGPVVFGYIVDTSGSYRPAWAAAMVAVSLAIVPSVLLHRQSRSDQLSSKDQ